MIAVIVSLPQVLFGLSIVALIAGLKPLGRLKLSCALGIACIAASIVERLS